MSELVRQELLDEALRLGNSSVLQANRHMRINRVFTEAIKEAIELMETGRTDQAHGCLKKAIHVAARILT